MLNPEIIKKANQIFLKSRHKVTDIFSGEFESAFRGRGIEFEEFREYIPGDDIRQIDWNVTARSNTPHVKIFREEREQTLFFLVDFSKSLDFGGEKTKREVITEITALLAYATIKSQDKVGLITFTDEVETFIPPKKGRSHVWNVISKLLESQTKGERTDLASALEFFLKVQRKRCTVFVLSDFFDEGFEDVLKVAKFKHDIVLIRLRDEMEVKPLPSALMDLEDLEGEGLVTLDLNSSSSIGKQQQALKERDERFTGFLRAQGIDFLDLKTHEEPVDKLIQFFIRREKRR